MFITKANDIEFISFFENHQNLVDATHWRYKKGSLQPMKIMKKTEYI